MQLIMGLTGVLLSLLFTVSPTEAQDFPCVTDFEVLAATTMQNYAAYPIEVRGRRDVEYAKMMTRVRGEARRASTTAACIYALREYTGWFYDPHLFITEFPHYTEDQLDAFSQVERRPLSRGQFMAYLAANRANLDPVEGIWYDETGEIAVVRETAAGPDEFVGVVLAPASEAWAPGDVKARIKRMANHEYRVMLRMDDRSPRHVEGALHKGGMLFRLAPYAWGRRFPVEPHQEGILHPTDPRAPTLRLQDSATVVVSVPSHNPKYRGVLDSLVHAHAADLQRASTLIIDIRGNEGGSSRTTSSLEPYYYSAVQEAPSRAVGPPVVLASPANLKAFQEWTQWYEPVPPWLTNLLQDLEERSGELITYTTPDDEESADHPMIVHENPDRVVVLIDGGVVSAGEGFILKARRYDRVTIYGQPTEGSIDYQNVQLLPLASRSRGFFLGYPTQAATMNLPEDGYNRTGVEPDVLIAEEIEDPISFILRKSGNHDGGDLL